MNRNGLTGGVSASEVPSEEWRNVASRIPETKVQKRFRQVKFQLGVSDVETLEGTSLVGRSIIEMAPEGRKGICHGRGRLKRIYAYILGMELTFGPVPRAWTTDERRQ